jgi:cytoskeletal protein CcmA (bactofilin family)/ribosomal protein S27E
VANPSPAKVRVECPHCGFKQMEYAAAKSSICRQCGRYFSPFAPKPGLKLAVKEETPAPATESSSVFKKFEGLWNRQRSSVVECFECKRKHQVSGAATSTICPGCSAHIDLNDYNINSSFSRTIRTCGHVHLTAKGDLSSSSVVCSSALIEGKLRGNLQCNGVATVNFSGKIPGRLTAKHVIVERKANIHCFRRVRVETIEIKGNMSGEIVAQGTVTIHKKGLLEGNVTARAIRVEKGGIFSGQLVIGQADLMQGELLSERKSATTGPVAPDVPGGEAQPLAAT